MFSLGCSNVSSFVKAWKEAPIKYFIFCRDFGRTAIKLFQWNEVDVFKTYQLLLHQQPTFLGYYHTSNKEFENLFSGRIPRRKKLLNVFGDTSLSAFLSLLAYFACRRCISLLLSDLQNSGKFFDPHKLAPLNRIYISQLHSILICNLHSNKLILNVKQNINSWGVQHCPWIERKHDLSFVISDPFGLSQNLVSTKRRN